MKFSLCHNISGHGFGSSRLLPLHLCLPRRQAAYRDSLLVFSVDIIEALRVLTVDLVVVPYDGSLIAQMKAVSLDKTNIIECPKLIDNIVGNDQTFGTTLIKGGHLHY